MAKKMIRQRERETVVKALFWVIQNVDSLAGETTQEKATKPLQDTIWKEVNSFLGVDVLCIG